LSVLDNFFSNLTSLKDLDLCDMMALDTQGTILSRQKWVLQMRTIGSTYTKATIKLSFNFTKDYILNQTFEIFYAPNSFPFFSIEISFGMPNNSYPDNEFFKLHKLNETAQNGQLNVVHLPLLK
jgi:hypothetical protein